MVQLSRQTGQGYLAVAPLVTHKLSGLCVSVQNLLIPEVIMARLACARCRGERDFECIFFARLGRSN